jgi:hypothetical protein
MQAFSTGLVETALCQQVGTDSERTCFWRKKEEASGRGVLDRVP